MTDERAATPLDESPPPRPEGQGLQPAGEQRAHVRYYYSYRPPARYGQRGAVCEGEARLHDVSAGGAALLAQRQIQPGTVLFVRLPTDQPGETLTQLAQVVHARRLGPLSWLIGCAFLSRLRDGDLERVRGEAE